MSMENNDYLAKFEPPCGARVGAAPGQCLRPSHGIAVRIPLVGFLIMLASAAITPVSAQPINFVLKWGSVGPADGQFRGPRGLAVDPQRDEGSACRNRGRWHCGHGG